MSGYEEHKHYNEQLFRTLIGIYDVVALFLIPVRARIEKILHGSGSKKILDVACGTGSQAIRLAGRGFQVSGIDIARVMLHRAMMKNTQMNPVNFLYGDATQIPFSDNTFDATVISFALHDMPKEIRTSVLLEARRVTRLNGRIVIADYAQPIKGIVPTVVHLISKLFESKYYHDFIGSDIDVHLSAANLTPSKKALAMLGVAQIILCEKVNS